MRKILIFLLLAVFTLCISAQSPSKKCPVCGLSIPKCQYKGKHPKKKPTPTTPARQQPSKPAKPSKPKPITVSRPTGTIEGHGYVDLGLSVKWATCNIGADSPEDYGDYFAWGETETKSESTVANCKTIKKQSFFAKLLDFGRSDNNANVEKLPDDISGNAQYDAARANWGGSWRMPTIAELDELCTKCEWTWTSQGGYEGYKVTGPNGNCIFLPAAGWGYGTGRLNVGENGYYWSSTLSALYSGFARDLNFNTSSHHTSYDGRGDGRSVRPVTE